MKINKELQEAKRKEARKTIEEFVRKSHENFSSVALSHWLKERKIGDLLSYKLLNSKTLKQGESYEL